mgnify:CR=1 FL=1
MKCIDEEIPFEIPQGWEWCRLSLLIYPPKYGTSKKSVPSGLLPVLRMGNIQDGEIVFDKLVYSNDLDDNKKLLLQYGDLLFNRTNSAELVGKTAIFRGQRNAIFAGYLILLRPIFINSEYLNLLLNTPYARDYCNEVKTIGVQQCNINAEKISNLLVPIPSLFETVRIVEKVKNIALPIIKYGEFYQKLKHLNRELPIIIRKSILQEAIQGKLVPQIAEEGTARELLEQIKTEKEKLVREGKLKKSALTDSVIFRGDDNKYWEKNGKNEKDITDEIPFEIPDSWAWVRLSSISDITGGYAFQSSSLKEELGKRVIRISDISEQGFVNTKIVRYNGTPISDIYRIQKFDIIMAMTGGTVGKSLFVRELPEDELLLNQRVARIRNLWISVDYLNFVIIAPHIKEFISKQKNSTNDNISMADISNFLIPLPSIKEQLRIVEKLYNLASIMSR